MTPFTIRQKKKATCDIFLRCKELYFSLIICVFNCICTEKKLWEIKNVQPETKNQKSHPFEFLLAKFIRPMGITPSVSFLSDKVMIRPAVL